ncbi:MAG: PilZ domain-containing protein [Desulfomonilaceae bacterium]|nr:PilZ domain-containing protein [Desulfomonilaceae bacterium]
MKDIRAGLDDQALMDKYKLSAKGLQNLFDELAYLGFISQEEHREVKLPKRKISASDFVDDVRGGMSQVAVMEKYGLSSRGLVSAYRKLVDAGILQPAEVPQDLDRDDVEVVEELRDEVRCHLDFELPVIDVGSSEVQGRVRDITVKGLGVIGIPAEIDELKTFMVFHEKFALIKPFLIEARCRWAKKESLNGRYIAGFEITNTSEKDLEQLRKLVKIVRLCS